MNRIAAVSQTSRSVHQLPTRCGWSRTTQPRSANNRLGPIAGEHSCRSLVVVTGYALVQPQMKIKKIDTLVCHARMRNWIFAKVVTDQPGLIGWGEATL